MAELHINSSLTTNNCLDCHLNFVRNLPISHLPSLKLHKLTDRELDVIINLARGLSNKKIAQELDLAESTVKIHIQGILRKLKLTSRLQVVVFVLKHGLDITHTVQGERKNSKVAT
jgi:DNA-binding NarL/FixJ family response regulator